jgi:GNAT superfamily N-acetyltransferase
MNATGMKGYIPENILVYLATDSSAAPLGAGANLLKRAINEAEGDVALHVEYNNSAKTLYETLGFTSKYVEMRYKKQ